MAMIPNEARLPAHRSDTSRHFDDGFRGTIGSASRPPCGRSV